MFFYEKITRKESFYSPADLIISLFGKSRVGPLGREWESAVSRKSLKIAILGAGVFGRYHAMKARAHARVSHVTLYDPQKAKLISLADELKLTAQLDLEAAINESDAVIIAAPAPYHAQLTLKALGAGKHCLIEKPLAHNLEQGRAICDLARDKKLNVHVGHQERYVLQAIGLDTILSRPKLIELYRENPFGPRGTDVSVSLDLTVHDLDMVMWLLGGEPLGVLATGESVRTEFIDRTRAELLYENSKAVIHTSRVANEGRRFMRLTYDKGTVEIDFNSRKLKHNTPFMLNEDFTDDPRARDALAASDDAFYQAVLHGAPSAIPPEDGLRALEWAVEIDNLILGTSL